MDLLNNEIIFLAGIIYLFIVISLAKLGSERNCGGIKAFLISLFFTPVVGLIYVFSSSPKNTLKIIHYRCTSCGLDYTSRYRYCPSCEKEGKSNRLKKISMKTF
jgi:hypothetical protein